MTIFEDFVVQGQGLLVVNWSSSTRTFLKDNTGYIMGVPPLQQFDFLRICHWSGHFHAIVTALYCSKIHPSFQFPRHV